MSSKHDLLKVLDDCPLGYVAGKVIMPRNLSEADLLAWLVRLYEVKESLRKELGYDGPHPFSHPVVRGLRKLLSLTDMFLNSQPDLTDSQVGDLKHAQEWIKWRIKQ